MSLSKISIKLENSERNLKERNISLTGVHENHIINTDKNSTLMNNTADINIWIDYANADLEAAERLLNSPDPNNWTFLLTAWHCHQAIEKILKTVIVAKGKELLRIHDLGKLYSLTETQLDKEHVAFIENLNQYYIHSRYPDFLYPPLPKLDKEKTGQILQTTKHIYSTIKGRL